MKFWAKVSYGDFRKYSDLCGKRHSNVPPTITIKKGAYTFAFGHTPQYLNNLAFVCETSYEEEDGMYPVPNNVDKWSNGKMITITTSTGDTVYIYA